MLRWDVGYPSTALHDSLIKTRQWKYLSGNIEARLYWDIELLFSTSIAVIAIISCTIFVLGGQCFSRKCTKPRVWVRFGHAGRSKLRSCQFSSRTWPSCTGLDKNNDQYGVHVTEVGVGVVVPSCLFLKRCDVWRWHHFANSLRAN
jgi:hypothetical protein